MTGTELLRNAIALMHEDDTSPYETVASPMINLVLAECYDAENALRLRAGKPERTEIPRIGSLAEEIDYEPELLRRALILGVCCRIYVDEDNNPILQMYKQEYAMALADASVCVAGVIRDVYAGGEG